MFRSYLRRLYYHTTSPLTMPKTFEPRDWRIVKTSSSGLELTFTNDGTRESTWYTPEGMTAAEIFAIPNAKEHWDSIEDVQQHIEKMAEEKAGYGGEDIDSAA